MQLKTENGSLHLYNDNGDFQVIDGIKSIKFSADSDQEVPLQAVIEVMLTTIDVIIPCEGLNQDIKVFNICPICGKKKIECLCKQSNFANTVELCVRDEHDKAFGYVQSITIEQLSSKPVIHIKKYEKDNEDNLKLDEDKQLKLFEY
jgi:hypothetical protein